MNEPLEEQDDPIDLLERLEALGLLADSPELRRFLCHCCRLIRHRLPARAQDALKIAELYAGGRASSEALADERVKLWQLLGGDACDFASAKVNAVRAVIGCLYERIPEQEGYDYARTVVDFCNAVEDKRRSQCDLLKHAFSCLNTNPNR